MDGDFGRRQPSKQITQINVGVAYQNDVGIGEDLLGNPGNQLVLVKNLLVYMLHAIGILGAVFNDKGWIIRDLLWGWHMGEPVW
ncbi:hypothetical protein [Candidatus Poriferisocius sp.]|uniref:hypothetical protein n=1 Tax=Candidatus Poriferisocius sp. TaxID=3101276 RepID=UPI003B5A5F0A